MPSAALGVLCGLISAAAWGAGDFSGGLATKRAMVPVVIVISQFVGAILLIAIALAAGDRVPPSRDLALGAAAGISGAIGLAGLYSGLASGRAAFVAPITAVFSALIPIFAALFTEGAPTAFQLAGFAFALLAVWLLTRPDAHVQIHASDFALPVAAGLFLGGFYVLTDRAVGSSFLWPLAAARAASVALFSIGTLPTVSRRRAGLLPPRDAIPLIFAAGVLDTAGNAFFALAAQFGRLDVAAVLASLYPASTVILAWLVSKEQLNRTQLTGLAAALIALALIS